MRHARIANLCLLSTALTSIVSASAMAQDIDKPEAEARFGKVTVTAQRRAENIQDVPIAISAFSADDLEIVQVNDTVDLVDTIPNLIGGNNTSLGTATSYFLRGQGQDESFPTFDPAIGTYVDEVFVARQNANNFNLFDVERMEVLRGPQGTLFGKNTTGGAVNIVMRKPDEELGGYIEAGVGRFNRVTVRGSVDVPLSDQVRTKFSAFSIRDDGWLENTADGNSYNDKEATGFRAALSSDFSDTLTWDLVMDYVEDSQANITGNGPLIGDEVQTTSILPQGLGAVFPGSMTKQKAPFGNKTESFNVSSNLAWESDSGTLNFIIGNRNLEQEFLANFPLPNIGFLFPSSPDDIFIIDNVGEHDQFSAELKWTASYFDDRMDLVAGLFYLEEENTTDVASYFAGPTPTQDRIIKNDTTNIAVYAQADYTLTDSLTATVGVRYTEEEKDFAVEDNQPSLGGAGGVTGDQTDLTTANMIALGIPTRLTENVVTPRFALTYDVNKDIMFFASATRGFRSGGWNARVATASGLIPFDAEKVWSYELGARTEFSDALIVNATLFALEVDDLQINTATGGGTFLIGNAGKMENQGLEIEAFYTPIDNLNLFAFLGLQNARYKPDASEIASCTAPNSSLGAFASDCSIADVKRTPEWTLNIGGSYDFDLPNGGSLSPRASLRAVPDHITTSRNRGPSGDYTLYNLGVQYSSPNNRWSATLECTNCGDERYLASTFGLGDIYYNQPGRWEARLNYRFGGARR